jgi:4-aminobutyrate aminotransferase/(S)-3-amino-2-methylpropionate transaminase
MVAIELFEVRDRPIAATSPDGATLRPDAALTKRVVAEAARRGLILLSCGTEANVIRILVPLTASDALLAEGLQILDDSLAAVQ